SPTFSDALSPPQRLSSAQADPDQPLREKSGSLRVDPAGRDRTTLRAGTPAPESEAGMPLKIADPQLDRADAKDAVLHCTTLPTLPAVAARVLELTADPDVTLPQVAALISTDQGLSAKMLRTVNSSFYGVRHKCSTVNQAVALLGLGAVRCLSLGFALVGAIGDEP